MCALDGNLRKIIKKIEAKPIDSILDPYADEQFIPTEEELEAWRSDDLDDEPELIEERLDYSPWIARDELRHVRELSPRERQLPKSERIQLRRERLDNFKGQLLRQKEGIAAAIEYLRSTVEATSNTSAHALREDIRKYFAPQFRLSPYQLSNFDTAIERYERKHESVEKYRTQYPEDQELFQAVFGRSPLGNIEIVKGPMTVFFRCFDVRDYAFIYRWEDYKDRGDEVSDVDIEKAALSVGFAKHSGCLIDELQGTITAERAAGRSTDASRRTRLHEDQHQFNELFVPLEQGVDEWQLLERVAERARTPEEAINLMIRGLVRVERRWMVGTRGIDAAARDEILAQYKGGRSTDETLEVMLTHELYDYPRQVYWRKAIDRIPATIVDELSRKVSEVFYQKESDGGMYLVDARALQIREEDVLPHIEAVFGDEYKDDLVEWVGAITSLEKKGYDREQVIFMLSQEPAQSWKNLVRRVRPI